MSAPVERVRTALGAGGCGPRDGSEKFTSRCPAHEDKSASLSVGTGSDGRALLRCFAGCSASSIVSALGLSLSDLFVEQPQRNGSAGRSEPRQSVTRKTVYKIRDASGAFMAEHVRSDLSDGSKTFKWRRDGAWGLGGLPLADLPLYGVHEVGAYPEEPVVVTEGEKARDALAERGIVAVGTVTGANGCPTAASLEPLRGRRVTLWPDGDVPGGEHMIMVAEALRGIAASVRIFRWDDAPPKGDAADWVGETEDLRRALAAAEPWSPAWAEESRGDSADSADAAAESWPAPMPLDARGVPAFPSDALPGWAAEWVEAEADATQTPAALAGLVALGALSTAAARAGFRVCPAPGWVEPINVFMIAALPSANLKSAVFSAGTRPLVEWERAAIQKYGPEVAKRSAACDVLAKRLEKAKKAASDATGLDGAQALRIVDDLAAEVAATRLPTLPRLFAQDVTPEKLGTLLAEQGGTFALLGAEGGIFETFAGRYSEGIPNFDVLLNAHAGDSIRVDRGSRDAVTLDHPALTVVLVVQPDVLAGLAKKQAFRGRGLLARFGYVVPVSLLGRRKIPSPSVPASVEQEYRRRITTLLDLGPGLPVDGGEGTAPTILHFDPAAQARMVALRRALEPRLGPGGDLVAVSDWAGKYAGLVARFAGLLHVGDGSHEGTLYITASTVERAERIGAFMLDHALAAFDVMGADPATDGARHILDYVTRKRLTEVTLRGLFEGVRGRSLLQKVGDVRAAVDVLVETGWMRPAPAKEREGPGRHPSPTYLIHPKASAQSAESSGGTNSADSADGFGGSATREDGRRCDVPGGGK